jgi:hypothetical protein
MAGRSLVITTSTAQPAQGNVMGVARGGCPGAATLLKITQASRKKRRKSTKGGRECGMEGLKRWRE